MSYARHLTRSALRDLERKLREEGGAEQPDDTILGSEPDDDFDALEDLILDRLAIAGGQPDGTRSVRELIDEILTLDAPNALELLETHKTNGPYLAIRKRLDRLNRRDLVAKIPRDDPPREGTVVYHR